MVPPARVALVSIVLILGGSLIFADPQPKVNVLKTEHLGLAFYYGLHSPQDYNKAYQNAQREAATGDSSAIVIEALCVGRGRGAAQDILNALRLLEPLLIKDDPLAHAAAAVIMGKGRSADDKLPPILASELIEELLEIPVYDPEERRKHIEKALSGLAPRLTNDAVAIVVTGQLLAWGVEAPKNEKRALQLFHHAWELGCSEAGDQIGIILSEGDPVRRDKDEAMRWYRKAADAGNSAAKFILAQFQLRNPSSKESIKKWKSAMLEAAESGQPHAMEILGYALSEDEACDLTEAKRWLEAAAEYGDRDGMARLGQLLGENATDDEQRRQSEKLLRRASARGSNLAAIDLSLFLLTGARATKPNPELGFLIALALAADGNRDAFGLVGLAYQRGLGVGKDPDQAFTWYQKGIHEGSVMCEYYLGRFYDSRNCGKFNPALAYAHYQKAAKEGYPAAMMDTGGHLLFGKGVAKDEAEGLKWLEKASSLRSWDAKALVGWAFQNGLGVPSDPPKAVAIYQDAAAKGSSRAMFNLAACLQKGIGVNQDLSEAVIWLRKGANMGDGTCCYQLALALENGLGVKKDLDESWQWLTKASELENAGAYATIGNWHRLGVRDDSSPAEAFEWYQKAADGGDAMGINNLGCCYQFGNGVKADGPRAFELYSRAAEMGYLDALVNLAICYEEGVGVSVDLFKAQEFRTKAAAMYASEHPIK